MASPCLTTRPKPLQNSLPTSATRARNRRSSTITPETEETNEMSTTLAQQLDEFLAGWKQRVPPERQAAMERHIAYLTETAAGKNAKQIGDQAPDIVLPDATGKSFAVADLLAKGPVIVTFYRGGWCPYCNLELKAYPAGLPRITAAG